MDTKQCIKCGRIKPIAEFHRCGKYRQSHCRSCAKTYGMRYRATHPKKEVFVSHPCCDCGRQVSMRDYSFKKWKGRYHPCARVKVGRECRGIKRSDEHRRKTGIASRGRKKSPSAIEKARQSFTGSNNPNWNPDREQVARNERARVEIHSLIHGTLKRLKAKKLRKSVDLVGYTPLELFEHLTRLFKPGMSWERRGEWHIDHIKPVSAFIAEGVTDPRIINALSNLQPLWKRENESKGGLRLVA